jgi:hypothetical protein
MPKATTVDAAEKEACYKMPATACKPDLCEMSTAPVVDPTKPTTPVTNEKCVPLSTTIDADLKAECYASGTTCPKATCIW